MHITIKTWDTEEILFNGEGENLKSILEKQPRINLINADLSNTDLREANLREADLREANLSNAHLSGASILASQRDDLLKSLGVQVQQNDDKLHF